MRESIFYSALRAFFVALLAVLDFCLALIVVALGLSFISTNSTEPTQNYTVEVLPNAEGKRKALSSGPVKLYKSISMASLG